MRNEKNENQNDYTINIGCKVGSKIYCVARCEDISMQLDDSLYGSDGGPGTATGYYCPYEDKCPFIMESDDCDSVKGLYQIFLDHVSAIHIDECGVHIIATNCCVDDEYIFTEYEAALDKLKEVSM